MTSISFLVIIALFVALLVVGAEDMGSGHTVFANRDSSGHMTFTNKGINVQTDTNQDQGCEGAGGMSGITNACTATSGRGSSQTSIQTSVALSFGFCGTNPSLTTFTCGPLIVPTNCNNIGCTSINCNSDLFMGGTASCTTNNGVQLTSCSNTPLGSAKVKCTLTETQTGPGTGISQSGGVSGG